MSNDSTTNPPTVENETEQFFRWNDAFDALSNSESVEHRYLLESAIAQQIYPEIYAYKENKTRQEALEKEAKKEAKKQAKVIKTPAASKAKKAMKAMKKKVAKKAKKAMKVMKAKVAKKAKKPKKQSQAMTPMPIRKAMPPIQVQK